MIKLHNTITQALTSIYHIIGKLLFVVLLALQLSCQGDSQSYTIESAHQSKSGVKYVFYAQNKKNRQAKKGDLLTFKLKVQNHQDSVLSNRTFQEYPFQEPYFISQPYYKDIFSMVCKGDSLCFWIPVDSLTNKPGFLRSPKIISGSMIKYTLKILNIQNKEDIRKKIEKDLKIQREEDLELIQKYKQTYLDTNLTVQTTTSGIHYFFNREGNGTYPQKGDTVSINYIGKLLDGTIYNQSEATNEFLLGDLTPNGLNECITLMKVGSKGTFIIPSELGHGLRGIEGVIPPNTVLVFNIELIEIK